MTPLLGYYGNRWQDHVMLRRVGNILLALWICIVNICRKIKGDSSKKSPSRQTITEFSRTHEEWKTDWDGWEGVKIEDTSPKQEDDVPDLFRDMQPNFQKPKKIKIKPKLNIEALTTPNLQQFAFDPTFQSVHKLACNIMHPVKSIVILYSFTGTNYFIITFIPLL
jgi:hypothetical protein